MVIMCIFWFSRYQCCPPQKLQLQSRVWLRKKSIDYVLGWSINCGVATFGALDISCRLWAEMAMSNRSKITSDHRGKNIIGFTVGSWLCLTRTNRKPRQTYELASSLGSARTEVRRWGLCPEVVYIVLTPLSFVRSGVVDLYDGSSKYVGRDGYNWGSFSTAFDSIITAAAYFLDLPPSYVLPSHGPGNRWTGFPIRCHPTQHRVILIPLFFNHSPRAPTFNQG